MKFYKSTAGCGYQQYAYVTPIAKNKNGNDYLCIWTNENSDMPIHIEGGGCRKLGRYLLRRS